MRIRFPDSTTFGPAVPVDGFPPVTYGVHQTLELQCVWGVALSPVDVQSLGMSRWTMDVAASVETPGTSLVHWEWEDDIATGSVLRLDFSATSVECYKYVAGRLRAPAVMTLRGYEDGEMVPGVEITLPVLLLSGACVERRPVDLPSALIEEMQRLVASMSSYSYSKDEIDELLDGVSPSAVAAFSSRLDDVESDVDTLSSSVEALKGGDVSVTSVSGPTLALGEDEAVVVWTPSSDCAIESFTPAPEGMARSWEVRLALQEDAAVSLCEGMEWARDASGSPDEALPGAVNVLLVRAFGSEATAYVCGTEELE